MPKGARAGACPGRPGRRAPYLAAVHAPDVDLVPPRPATAALLERAAALPRDSADRGAVMACWMIGRLAQLRLAELPDRPPAEAIRANADAVRAWIEALPANAVTRPALRRACSALSAEGAEGCASALEAVAAACAAPLGPDGTTTLATLAARFREPARPSRP